MKHKRFEENILVDEAYTNYGKVDKNADEKKSSGIAKHFAETLEFEDRKKWYDQMPKEPTTTNKTVKQEQIEELKKEASSALHGDTLAYETKSNRSGSSDQQWARTLLNKGAIGDRVAAATILIQDNPIYNLPALRNLVNNVKPAKKKDGLVIIDALSELLISELLIPGVKLRTFSQHPLGHIDEMTSGNKQAKRNIIKLWYYEDQLKELYGSYVEALNKFAHDSVEANKEKAVSAMSYLLMHHPEREKMLLSNIINKLGDPSQAVASKAIYHLCQLLYNHPNMKAVVLAEIEKLLFRSNISSRAQYYGICFLNQFFLGKDDSSIAENLIRIYFSFFKASIKKIYKKLDKISHYMTVYSIVLPWLTSCSFNLLPMYVNYINGLYSSNRPENATFKHTIYYRMPFDYETNVPGYIIKYFFNLFTTYACVICHTFGDLYMLLIVFNIIGHLKLLLHNLKLFPKPQPSESFVDTLMFSDEELENVFILLKESINHHGVVMDFVSLTSEALSSLLCIYYAFFQGILCMMLLLFSQLDVNAIVLYTTITLYFFQELIIISVSFEMLGIVGDKVRDAVYELPWECMDTKNRKIVLLFLSKAQEPIGLKALGILPIGVKTMAAGEIDSRLMSAILTGVKRAYPFANKDRLSETPEHIDAIHKLVHLASLNIAIHALALLFQISDASKQTSDRYYTALYRKLTNAEIFNTTHSALLFSLIYKSLKRDKNVNRVTAFIKRLLQLCCYMTPAQSCGMLLLISQVLKDGDKKSAIKLIWTKKEIKEEEMKEEPSEDQEENTENQKDTIEDINTTQNSNIEEVAGENVEQKRVDLLKGDKKDLLLEDDEDETYIDLKIDDRGNVKPKKRKAAPVTAGWYHAKVKTEGSEDQHQEQVEEKMDKETATKIQLKKTINMDRVITEYNPFTRNPTFSGAECSAYFELLPLAKHFHPTVKMFAEKILNDQIIQYSGDPLKDFSGIRFLDRFVFKNPKKRTEQRDDVQVKTIKGSHPKFAIRKNYTAKGIKGLPVNSASYLNEDVKRIPVDEIFLYDFLRKRREIKGSDDEDEDSDNDSITSEDFEKYLDSLTGTKVQDNDDEELDYLAEVQASKQKKGTKKDGGDDQLVSNEDQDDVGSGSDDGDSDGELNIPADEDEPVLSGEDEPALSDDDDDAELLLEDSDEDDQIDVPNKKAGKNKFKLNLKGKDDLGSLFASAEEFSTLLEDTATNKKQGSSQAVSNTDNASVKQLAWEEKRDRWIQGYNRKIHGNKKGGKNRKFNKKQDGEPGNKMAVKKSGKRKADNVNGVGNKKKKFK